MTRTVFGVETEYALVERRGERPDRPNALRRLRLHVANQAVQLPSFAGSGWFLGNGARFYVDHGNHPEYATPECMHPDDLVAHIAAGDRLLARWLDASRDGASRGELFRTNIDYSRTDVTWGLHESYRSDRPVEEIAAFLVGHLATRTIYTGAGGFDGLAPGIEFVTSPRSLHICQSISQDSTSNRGLVHTREEPLARDRSHRIHLICGESVRSPLATWLRVGATALVVQIARSAPCPVTISSAVDALHAIARDPGCRHRVRVRGARRWTAIEIQRRYLELVESRLAELPEWAPLVCSRWRSLLETLERGSQASDVGVGLALDWPLKRALFTRHSATRGFSPERITRWNSALRRVEKSGEEGRPINVRAAAIAEDLPPAQLEDFLRLRAELFVLDVRASEIGERNLLDEIFGDAQASGPLGPDADRRIEIAMREAPTGGRAELRGRAIREIHQGEASESGSACWTEVRDLRGQRRLDLPDPFATEATWTSMKDSPELHLRFQRSLREIFGRERER